MSDSEIFSSLDSSPHRYVESVDIRKPPVGYGVIQPEIVVDYMAGNGARFGQWSSMIGPFIDE